MATHIPPTLSPDAIDTLTELTTILTKFRAAAASTRQAAAASSSSGPNPSSNNGPNSNNPGGIGTPAPGAVTGTTPLPIPSTSNPNSTAASTSFTAKDLPQATDNLKHKLQRARQAVLTLPDIGRTIAQQEVEIKELEERKRKQIAMLARIREEGLQFARLEQSRRDEEGERMVE
ncbi:RNA polymerase II transcription mediator complex subunit 9-domain-containing protein [Neurospora tetraspora]|uniref:Mediator of RNA polymerase II transcription subunit 9 n=1 Tax=Neurospora tetraspora TaxID=94610 RepID=A0AAE0JJB6_9PEZI|nr:RNA polymerase II transcription mediator complex subunit 9-domain-containing protein [Neurospora tetraspora]